MIAVEHHASLTRLLFENDNAKMDQHAQAIVQAISPGPEFWDNVRILVGVLLLLVMLKSSLEEFVYGIFWRFRSDFNNRDIVRIDHKEWARIIHIGPLRTEFTIFEYNESDEMPRAGYTRFISNAKLRDFTIDKPLQLADIPRPMKNMIYPGAAIEGNATKRKRKKNHV